MVRCMAIGKDEFSVLPAPVKNSSGCGPRRVRQGEKQLDMKARAQLWSGFDLGRVTVANANLVSPKEVFSVHGASPFGTA